jgi:hypothetical protein
VDIARPSQSPQWGAYEIAPDNLFRMTRHAWNRNGQQTSRASLAGSHAVNDPQGANLIRVILEGTSAPDHVAATAMPSFGAAYTDAEIAAVEIP